MPQPQPITPGQILQIIVSYRLRWLIPAVLVAALAVVYAAMRPDVWQAAQALTVRDEAIGTDERQRSGQFHQLEQMAAVQETIMELAQSRGVLEAALLEVGPAGRRTSKPWPSADDIERLRKNVTLAPPKGAVFGRTEVFYLQVKDNSRTRAIALAAAIRDQLNGRFQELRNERAEGMVQEVTGEVRLARQELREVTTRLAAIESEVGGDLAELRMLDRNPSGDSDLRRKLTLLETELRAAVEVAESNRELWTLLIRARDNPETLIATPNSLLESQPALRRLKDGLIDTQLNTAHLLGRMRESHPSVSAARKEELEVKAHLHEELDLALRGLEVDFRLGETRVANLQEQLAEVRQRLTVLAGRRAEYANLIEELHRKTSVLNQAERQLASLRSSQAAALQTSLLHAIDAPDTGAKPIGPGRMLIVVAGIFGGLIVGAGVLFLTVVPPVEAEQLSGNPAADHDPLDPPAPRIAWPPLRTGAAATTLKKALARVAPRQPVAS